MRSSASAAISYTDSGAKALIADGWPRDRVFVSQNTLDTEMLERLDSLVSDMDVAKLRVKLGIGSRPALLFIGKLIPEKRLDVGLLALRELADPPVLVVIGDGPERDRLRKLALTEVLFQGAIYDEAELATYLRLAEFLLLPGRVGLTCIHGFAAGRPCVTTHPGEVDQTPEFEYVENGVNSVVVPSPNPTLHARVIESLLEDDVLLKKLSAGARQTARALRIDAMVSAYADAVAVAALPM
jgi:glycosyltransferase involved in cell wall biosynthesis